MRKPVRVGVSVCLLSLLVSPVGLALIVVLVERRPFVLADQYMAFLVGDVLLAVAAGLGLSVVGDRSLWSWWLLVPVAVGLLFGWWQIGHEVAAGVYTMGEAHSPSKLYHQFVCYPVLGALVSRALYLAWGQRVVFGVVIVLLLGWASANVWDWSHPKNPHQDFDWPSFSVVVGRGGR